MIVQGDRTEVNSCIDLYSNNFLVPPQLHMPPCLGQTYTAMEMKVTGSHHQKLAHHLAQMITKNTHFDAVRVNVSTELLAMVRDS